MKRRVAGRGRGDPRFVGAVLGRDREGGGFHATHDMVVHAHGGGPRTTAVSKGASCTPRPSSQSIENGVWLVMRIVRVRAAGRSAERYETPAVSPLVGLRRAP
jgi:hypothetical protein